MPRKPKRRQLIELTVEKVAFGGKGIAHLDDFVVFVEHSLPGDRVRARIRKVKKNYAEARPVEILEPSPLRQEAPCEHFGYCGGCRWQNVAYEQQLQFKKQHVLESLEHIGKVTPEVIHDPLPAPKIFGYRNKMEFSFTTNRWLPPEELADPEIPKGFGLGFHVPGRFDQVMDIHRCWLQSDLLNGILNFTRDFFHRAEIPAYNLHTHEGVLRFLVLRESFTHGQALVNVVTTRPLGDTAKAYARQLVEHFPAVVGVVNGINARPAQVAISEEIIPIYGESTLREKLGDYEFEISPNSFFQTNTLQAERLYEVARRYAEVDGRVVWDLYCGAGTISLFVSGKARAVIGFEIVEEAVADARRNAERNRATNCRFVAGDLKDTLMQHAHTPPEVVICDPPRAGMHPEVVHTLRRIAPPKIVYVSCNPATMARDLAELTRDYRLVEVQPVDMFPHTYHIESVGKLVRK